MKIILRNTTAYSFVRTNFSEFLPLKYFPIKIPPISEKYISELYKIKLFLISRKANNKKIIEK